MTLAPGTRLGPYEVVAPLGAGGMGEVYRARDTNLGRDVALKVLPQALAEDADRLARFEREAKALATFNHPAIAQIYGFEQAGATRAIVMELAHGEDLSQRIARGPVPIGEALAISRQIAEALEAAHEHGIVHRDLKPANIIVRDDGVVKVLDFGLAKAIDPGTGGWRGANPANSPTLTARGTQLGIILGTAAYMAPEQARGKMVDRRADLWAFGCVLFEMITGRPTFAGDETTDVLAEVIKSEPDWTALPKETPPQIQRLLRRCLVKDPKQRLADASTARFEIDEALRAADDQSAVAAPSSRDRSGTERLAWGVALFMTIVAATAIVVLYVRSGSMPAVPPEARLQIAAPGFGDPLLSPDGRHIVYRADRNGDFQLWIRPLDSETAKPLSGTSQTFDAFWSPDSRSLAFFSTQKLRRIEVATGAVQTLADAPTPRGGAWAPDGTILFAPGGNGPLFRIPATSGTPEPVTELRPEDASHRHPVFLPDGRHFLFWVLGPRGVRGEYIASLGTPGFRRLFDADGAATFAPPDHLLFIREGVLYAQRLDLARFTLAGDPMPVASNVSTEQTQGIQMSASASGVIAYRPDVHVRQQLVWRDRSGKQVGTIGEPLTDLGYSSLSPDGRTIAIARDVNGRRDIWLMEAARGTLTRFTSETANVPIWSPDGARIAFHSAQDGFGRLYWRSIGATGPDELLFKSSEAQNMNDWSPDGKYILFSSQSPTTARDLWALPVAAPDRTPRAVIRTPAEEQSGKFSPDGRWIAYVSWETGQAEIFVRPFPGPGRAWRVSTNGGSLPFWRRDGRELYYVIAGKLMAVPINGAADGVIDAGAPQQLFDVHGDLVAASDGQRFLILTVLDNVPTPPITVIVNWAARGR